MNRTLLRLFLLGQAFLTITVSGQPLAAQQSAGAILNAIGLYIKTLESVKDTADTSLRDHLVTLYILLPGDTNSAVRLTKDQAGKILSKKYNVLLQDLVAPVESSMTQKIKEFERLSGISPRAAERKEHEYALQQQLDQLEAAQEQAQKTSGELSQTQRTAQKNLDEALANIARLEGQLAARTRAPQVPGVTPTPPVQIPKTIEEILGIPEATLQLLLALGGDELSLLQQQVAGLNFQERFNELTKRLSQAKDLLEEPYGIPISPEDLANQRVRAQILRNQLLAYLQAYEQSYLSERRSIDRERLQATLDFIKQLDQRFNLPEQSEDELADALLRFTTKAANPQSFTAKDLADFEKAWKDYQRHPFIEPNPSFTNEINQQLETVRKALEAAKQPGMLQSAYSSITSALSSLPGYFTSWFGSSGQPTVQAPALVLASKAIQEDLTAGDNEKLRTDWQAYKTVVEGKVPSELLNQFEATLARYSTEVTKLRDLRREQVQPSTRTTLGKRNLATDINTSQARLNVLRSDLRRQLSAIEQAASTQQP